MYDEIIADEYQNELLSYQGMVSTASFRIGDICNDILDNDNVHKKDLIYKAIALYAGKSARTIREYSAVSRVYDRSYREAFDVLSYDHFRVALRYGDRRGDALRWAVTQTDEYNRPSTVDAMIQAFGIAPVPQEIRIVAMIDKIQLYVSEHFDDVDLVQKTDELLGEISERIRRQDKSLLINIL